MTQEKQQAENQLNAKLAQNKKEFDRQMEDLMLKMNTADEQKKEIQRQQVAESCEFDK